MLLLPFDNIKYSSHLTKQEILSVINNLYSNNRDNYSGKIEADSFRLNYHGMIMRGGGRYIAVVNGKVDQQNKGCIITIKTRVQYSVLIAMISVLTFLIYAIIASKGMFLNGKQIEDRYFILRFLPFVLTYASFITLFQVHNYRVKRDLKKLFEAEIVK